MEATFVEHVNLGWGNLTQEDGISLHRHHTQADGDVTLELLSQRLVGSTHGRFQAGSRRLLATAGVFPDHDICGPSPSTWTHLPTARRLCDNVQCSAAFRRGGRRHARLNPKCVGSILSASTRQVEVRGEENE